MSKVSEHCTGVAASGAVFLVSALVHGPAEAAPPSSPLTAPEYSVDRASPLVLDGRLHAGDLLERGVARPRIALPSSGLLLFSPLDDVDALSGPHVGLAATQTLSILFSVDRDTVGVSPPDPLFVALNLPYNVYDQAGRLQAAGDAFLAADLFAKAGLRTPDETTRQNNLLGLNNFDEGGSDLVLGPPTHASTWVEPGTAIDRVDAFAYLPRSGDGDVAAAYFSLVATSPALEKLDGTGADVFVAFVVSEGACCLRDECVVTTSPECRAAGGVWLGPGAECDDCRRHLGACCLEDGCIDAIAETMCGILGGVFEPGVTCGLTECKPMPSGACCIDGERCIDGVPQAVCEGNGGAFFPWMRCIDVPCGAASGRGMDMGMGIVGAAAAMNEQGCDAPAACCLPDGTCEVVDVVVCATSGGTPLDGTEDCAGCAAPGACCLPGGECIEINVATCELLTGEWRGPNTTCGDAGCGREPVEPALWRYASFRDLGLVADDEIDALVVIDEDMDGRYGGRDRVLFSLAPGSPSLTTIEGASDIGAAADVFVVGPGHTPSVFARARLMGLGRPVDNIDALEVVVEGETAAAHAIRGCAK